MKESEKKKKETEIDVFEIVACKEKKLQSFLNVFHFKEENFAKSQLGEIFGVIQIFDYSEQSAYLPNLIAQVIRKEFFSKHKIRTEEAFENALKKANIALSDLTSHEVVDWMGKMHAVIGVIHADDFFFTQSGGGRIVLLRDKKINDVSRDLDEGESGHPMKTFSNVSSGELMIDDKILFTTESLFDLLTWEDLKRHVKTFNSSEFDNLVKSTIESEAENVGSLVINIKEKIIKPKAVLPRTKKTSQQNFFGQEVRKKKKEKPPKEKEKEEVKNQEKIEEKEDEKKDISPFEKQPELFIKESESSDLGLPDKSETVFTKIKEAIEKTQSPKNAIQNLSLKKVPKKTNEITLTEEKKEIPQVKEETLVFEEKMSTDKKQEDQVTQVTEYKLAKNKERSQLPQEKATLEKELASFYHQTKKEKPSQKTFMQNSKEVLFQGAQKIKKVKNIQRKNKSKESFEKSKQFLSSHIKEYAKEIETLKQKIKDSKVTFSDIIRSRYIFSTIIALIISVLLLTLYFSKGPAQIDPATRALLQSKQNENLTNQNIPHENEIQTRTVGTVDSEITDITGYRNDVYVFTTDNSLYRYDSNINDFAGIPIPDNISDVKTLVSMPSLNLVFFVSNDSVNSFSPVLNRFDQHQIKMPSNADLIGAGVHRSFSHLYVLDRNSGQIYRYPRTEGGFDSPVEWFEGSISAEKAVDFAIDDGIRVLYEDGTIEQYYRKKLQDTFLLNTEPRAVPKKIFTNNETDFYYVLDKENPRVLKINKNGNSVEKQYWNSELANAKDLWVHENKEAYVATEQNKILQFDLQ